MLPLRPEHLEPKEPKSGLTRRQLLFRGAIATGGLLVSGTVIRFAAFLGQDPKSGLRALTAREIAILGPLVEALFPPGGELPPADLGYIVPRLDHFLASTDPDARLLFRSMLHVIEDHARVFRFSRFTKCSLADRTSEVEAWERTPIYTKRMAFSSVKLFIGIHYYEQPGVHESIGWYLGCAPADHDTAGEGLG